MKVTRTADGPSVSTSQDEFDQLVDVYGELLGEYGGVRGYDRVWRTFLELLPCASAESQRLWRSLADVAPARVRRDVESRRAGT